MKTSNKLLLSGLVAFVIASCHHHDPLAPSSPSPSTPTDSISGNNSPNDSIPYNPNQGGGTNNPVDTTISMPGGGTQNPTDSIPGSGGNVGNGSDSTFVFPTDSL